MMIQGPGGNLSVFQAAQVQPGRLTESVVFGESQSSTETESVVQYPWRRAQAAIVDVGAQGWSPGRR